MGGSQEFTDRTTWGVLGAAGALDDGDLRVVDYRSVVLIDGDGLARSTAWRLTGETDGGETVTAEWRYTVTGVGATTVAAPDWLADAETQGGRLPGSDEN